MKRAILSIALVLCVVAPVAAQETPDAVANGYDSLADAILALRDAEHRIEWATRTRSSGSESMSRRS